MNRKLMYALSVALSLVSVANGQVLLNLEYGLYPTGIGCVDTGGAVALSKVESLTRGETAVVKLLSAGQFTEAELRARSMIRQAPGRIVGHLLLAQSLRAQKSLPKVDALVKEYASQILNFEAERIGYAYALTLKLCSSNTDATIDQGLVKVLSEAQKHLDPKDVTSAISIADLMAHCHMSLFGKARKLMRRTIEAAPSSVEARYYLLRLCGEGVLAGSPGVFTPDQKPLPTEVVTQAAAIIALDPNFNPAYYFGGFAKLSLNDREGARIWLQHYRDHNPYKKGRYYDNAGKVLKELG